MDPLKTLGTIDGRYTVEKLIGSGGYKAVYLAEHKYLGKKVALKIMQEHACSKNAAELLKKEANLISRLSTPEQHPNIVDVLDFAFFGDPPTPYMVEELLDGRDLASLISDDGVSYDIHESLRIFSQIASAMTHSHSKGVVHSDLGPQNIMILRDNIVKVTDFGLAHLVDESILLAYARDNLSGILGSYSAGSFERISIDEDVASPAYDILCFGNIMLQVLPKIKLSADDRDDIEKRSMLDKIILKARAVPKARYNKMKDVLQDINAARNARAPAIRSPATPRVETKNVLQISVPSVPKQIEPKRPSHGSYKARAQQQQPEHRDLEMQGYEQNYDDTGYDDPDWHQKQLQQAPPGYPNKDYVGPGIVNWDDSWKYKKKSWFSRLFGDEVSFESDPNNFWDIVRHSTNFWTTAAAVFCVTVTGGIMWYTGSYQGKPIEFDNQYRKLLQKRDRIVRFIDSGDDAKAKVLAEQLESEIGGDLTYFKMDYKQKKLKALLKEVSGYSDYVGPSLKPKEDK